jgi:DNA-binding NtrC family response regulator
VRQAHSAGEALVVLRERAVDAVITDYNLGAHTETGCWLLERAHDEGLLDAVVAIIVYSALPYVTPPLSLPRARSFQKPTDIDVLLREIDRLLESAGNHP